MVTCASRDSSPAGTARWSSPTRRVIFKAATWEFVRQEIQTVEVEPPPGWFVRHVLGGLAWLIDSILFWLENPRKWATSVDIRLRDGRELAVCFDSRERALEFAAALQT